MFTSEKREMRARRGGRAKSSRAYPKIRRELFESPTKSGDADSASQRKDTNGLLSTNGPTRPETRPDNTGQSRRL